MATIAELIGVAKQTELRNATGRRSFAAVAARVAMSPTVQPLRYVPPTHGKNCDCWLHNDGR